MNRWILLLLPALLLGCESAPEDEETAKTAEAAAKTKTDPNADPLAPPSKTPQTWPPPRIRQPSKTSAPPAGPVAPPPSRPGAPPPAGPGIPPVAPAPAPAARGDALLTLSLHDVDVRAAVDMLAELAGVQVELSPWVRGRVSLTLQGKPWRYALTRLLVGVGEFDVLGNGDRVTVVPRQLRVVGTIVRVEADGLVVNDGKQTQTLKLPSGAEGGEAAHRRGDLIRALQLSKAGDRVVCGVAYLQKTHYLTAVLTRPAAGAAAAPPAATPTTSPPPTKTPTKAAPAKAPAKTPNQAQF